MQERLRRTRCFMFAFCNQLPVVIVVTAGTPEQQSSRGGAVEELRAMETCKKQKSRCQLCLFLRSNNVDLNNNSRNHWKPCWLLWVREHLQCFSFTSMLINHKITYDSVMKRYLCTRFERARGNTPVISPVSLKLPMMLLCKGTCAPVAPFCKGRGPVPSSCNPVAASLGHCGRHYD